MGFDQTNALCPVPTCLKVKRDAASAAPGEPLHPLPQLVYWGGWWWGGGTFSGSETIRWQSRWTAAGRALLRCLTVSGPKLKFGTKCLCTDGYEFGTRP